MRDASFSLLPDFLPRTFIVSEPVGVIIVLVRIEIPGRIAGGHFASYSLCAVRTLHWIRFDRLCPQNLQHTFALDAGVGRQTDSHRISAGRTDHGIGNSSIATGSIENYFARVKAAAALTIQNHGQGRTVFD